MNDTSPEIEAFLEARYLAMTGSERALVALEMFETAQQIVLSSLDPNLSESERRRELCRRFYGEELAQAAFPTENDAAPRELARGSARDPRRE
jgi:hypothetical protein